MSIFRAIPYAALSASLLAAGGASAQSMGSIDAREDHQQYRIDQGIRNGSLTPGEASRLEQNEQRIERYEQHARSDGSVSPYERQRLDNMLDREGHAIYREGHDGQRADGRGSGGDDGWGRDGWRRDAWGRDQGWGRDRDGWSNGNREGWNRGERGAWDGNRHNGIERRDGRDEQRIYNGVRDGSLNRREFGQLERGQDRINQYEARARSDGSLSPYERGRIDNMQSRESRQIYADRRNNSTAPTTTGAGQPTTGSHAANGGWGNGGWQRGAQAGGTTTPTAGGQNWGGWHSQQASAAPATTQSPAMTRASAPSTGGRSWGGRH